MNEQTFKFDLQARVVIRSSDRQATVLERVVKNRGRLMYLLDEGGDVHCWQREDQIKAAEAPDAN